LGGICAAILLGGFLLNPHSVFAADPSTTGLTAYWTFDEGTASTTSDSSGSGHTGSMETGITWKLDGQIGPALDFAGSTNGIATKINAGADFFGETTLTVSAWVYPRTVGQNGAGKIIDNTKTMFQLDSSRRLRFSNNGSTLAASSGISLNTWTFVTVTRGPTGLVNYYVNGAATSTANQNAGATTTASTVYIGNRANGTTAWDGYIDELRIYNRVLDSSEITDLYNAASSSPDLLPPVLLNGLPTGQFAEGTSQATLMASTTENATCKYGTTSGTAYASIANTFSGSGTKSHTATVTGLVGGLYNYYVRCQDTTGNTNTTDYNISFTIVDTAPPVQSSIASSSSYTTATITWTTDEVTDTQINYGTTTAYTATTTLASSLVTSHSQTISELKTGTTYHYRVRSTDNAGNLTVSSDQTFTTTSFGGVYPVVDIYVDMEGGTINATTTPAILTAGTHGTGFSWSTSTPFTAIFVSTSTSAERELPVPVQVTGGGTIYDDSNSSKGWAYDQRVNDQSVTLDLPGVSYNNVSVSGFTQFNTIVPTNGDNQQWDHVAIQGLVGIATQGAVMQQHVQDDGTDAGVNELRAHVSNASGSTFGNGIPLTLGKIYWYSMKWSKDDLMVYLSLYDPINWSLVGTSSLAIISDANQNGTAAFVQILQDHGVTSSSYQYYDDMLVDYTNALYPLVPDAYPPLVEVTVPSNSATVSGVAVTLTASSTDNVAIVGVQFKLDTNTLIGSEDTTSPYSLTWDSTGVSNGSHTIIAVSRDTLSNYATSSAITVTVNNDTAPTVTTSATVASITPGSATLNGSITATGGVNATAHGFSYGTVTNLSPAIATTTGGAFTGTGAFTSASARNLSSLSCGTSYYYRAYATNSVGTGYGTIVSFTTGSCISSLSDIATSTVSSNTATINWTSDVAGSSQLEFGVDANYGTTTSEANTDSRVTSHSLSFPPQLLPCTIYHYRVRSRDLSGAEVVGSDKTFTTPGCTGSASVSSSTASTITAASGGTLNFRDSTNNNTGLLLTVPSSFTSSASSASFQSKQLDKTSFFSSVAAPSGFTTVGSYLYNLKALADATTTVSSFDQPIAISMYYNASDISGLDETTLTIKRYDGSSWDSLTSCTTDTSARTVTCTTTSFSDFALFGSEETTTAASSQSSSGGGGIPVGWTVQPVTPTGGFKIAINQNEQKTVSRIVTLKFNAGADIKKIAISMSGDFTDASQEEYSATMQWDLCSRFGGYSKKPTCPNGIYTVYAKFFTAHGVTSGKAVAWSSITLDADTSNAQGYRFFRFQKSLKYGQTGADSKRLQVFLNQDPDTKLANSGAGSPGKETDFFGPATFQAVVRFQEKYTKDILTPWSLIKGTGFFGQMSIKKANALLQK